MSAKSIDIIEKAWKEAENENNKEAITILEQAIRDFPEEQEEIILQLAQIYFRDRQYLKALEKFEIYYNYSKDENVLESLLQCYYEPNSEEYKKILDNNIEQIKSYKYFYGQISKFGDLMPKILWHDENQVIYYSNHKISKLQLSIPKDNVEKSIIMLINEWSIENILSYEKVTKEELNCLTAENPMYLYYDESIFSIVTQLIEFQNIIGKNRIAVIVGKKELKEFFDDTQVMVPAFIIGNDIERYVDIIKEVVKKNIDCFEEGKKLVEEYYKENSMEILENIKNGNPKILFTTSRFTTVLQYHTRDCNKAALEIGLKTSLLIEKSDIHRVTALSWIDEIYKLKPDIIFCIDHFRFENPFIPEEIVFVSWVQDPLPNIMDADTPSKLSEREFVLNHLYTWKEFEKLNYPKSKLNVAPIPSNHNVYKPYELSNEEKEKYSCDICFVCHGSDFKEELNNFLEKINSEFVKEYLKKMAYQYYEEVYEEGKLYYSKEEFNKYFLNLIKEWNSDIYDDMIGLIDIFAGEMSLWINQRIFRVVLVNWLIDAGYENIRLWGNGWLEQEKFKKYAMGSAENGETLSKIYQCSKINIGNNIGTTAAARAWESMLSGGFYMSNYIPKEYDMSDIRKILSEDELVMFYNNKEDFLAKVKYYLENEDKRLEMTKIGRKCALERMTFKALMKKTIKNIGEYYKKGN